MPNQQGLQLWILRRVLLEKQRIVYIKESVLWNDQQTFTGKIYKAGVSDWLEIFCSFY